MMVVTYIPRMLPLVVLSKVNIPGLVLRWLKFIPVAVLSSLLAPELLLEKNTINISLDNTVLLAAFPTFLAAVYTRNLFFTVFAGMGSIVLITRFMA